MQVRAPLSTVVAIADRGPSSGRGNRLRGLAESGTDRGAAVTARSDGIVAIFSSAVDAVAWALDPAVSSETAAIGLATGVADPRRGSGDAVARAMHVCAVAHAGQILAGRSAYDAVGDRLPDGVGATALGLQRLADLRPPEQIHQLHCSAHREAFPALRSLDSVPNNLPLQTTSFVGREAELSRVLAAVTTDRIVTLTGAGGCGKTRLALHVAAAAAADHPDGVWIADLAPLGSSDLVAHTLAAAAGIDEPRQQLVTDHLVAYFGRSVCLVVLDNCEHVVDGARPLAEQLVEACPSLTVLATSREPLGAHGERVWTVPSLDVPARDDHADEAVASVRLFIDRALAARSNFRADDRNLPAIAEICRRLDGIPLAIELAAARSRALTPGQIAEQLSDRFALLTSRGGRLARQQTLEASVDWSYDLLEEEDGELLRQLSVFVGTFTLDAVEGVCADVPSPIDSLSRLVDRSLVQPHHEFDPPRYRLLDTIRYYARNKLVAVGGSDAVRDRHLSFYASVAIANEPHAEGPEMRGVLEELDRDIDNFRAAHEWSLDGGSHEAGLALVVALWNLWYTRHCSEGTQRVATSFARPSCDTAGRARAAMVAAELAFYGGDVTSTKTWADQARALASDAGHERTVGRAAAAIAWSNLAMNLPGAMEGFREALEIVRQTDDGWLTVSASAGLVCGASFSGDPAAAAREAAAIVGIARELGNRRQLETALIFASLAELAEPRSQHAMDQLREAIAIGEEIRDGTFTPVARALLAAALSLRGEQDEALATAEAAIAEAERNHSIWAYATGMAQRTYTLYERGDLDRALLDAQAIADLSNVVPLGVFSAWTGSAHSNVLRELGRIGEAIGLAEESLDASDGIYAGSCAGPAEVALARALVCEGQRDRALTLAHQALVRPLAGPWRPGGVEPLELIAELIAGDEPEDSIRLIAAADAHRTRSTMPLPPIARAPRAVFLGALQTAVRDGAFASRWAEGSAMTLEDAVAFARRGRGRRARATSGWHSLTPTEVEVARLVAQGMRNADICEKLFVSSSTVKTHLSHIFAKLGVRSRAQLATEVTRRGI